MQHYDKEMFTPSESVANVTWTDKIADILNVSELKNEPKVRPKRVKKKENVL